jgi:hypothetical protein
MGGDWPAVTDEAPEIVWYVVFEEANTIWWHRWLKPGFRHCWAFKVQVIASDPPRGEWILVDPLFTGVDIRLVPPESAVGWLALAGIEGSGLQILRVPEQRNGVIRPRFFVSCAGALAAVLGLRQTPWTPWGLYWRLRRLPGVEVI